MDTGYSPVSRWSYINKEGVEEDVTLERWIWTVIYENDAEFVQFDQQGVFHQFAEIDLRYVKRFSMVNTLDTRKQISLVIPKGAKPFHFYRNTVLRANTPQEVRLKTYGFGYQLENGFSMYHYILPDDRLVITTDKNFNPIKQS